MLFLKMFTTNRFDCTYTYLQTIDFLSLLFLLVNTSGEPLKKRPRRSSNFVHEFAPGERKKATNWIRDENHDTKGFPCLFHDGKCGLNDKNRKRKIPAKQNFCQKVLQE